MRTLFSQQEFRLLNLSIFLLHTLFKAYILTVTSWCQDGCQISSHHICNIDSKNEKKCVVGWGTAEGGRGGAREQSAPKKRSKNTA